MNLPEEWLFKLGDSSKKAGGGGKFSSLLTGVRGLLVFVIDEVRRIGGSGLLP